MMTAADPMTLTEFLRSKYPKSIRVWRLRPGTWAVLVGSHIFAYDSFPEAIRAADEWASWRPRVPGRVRRSG